MSKTSVQYIGFFNTGAYQESLSGYGGIQHCLIPQPKHVEIELDENGEIKTRLFAKEHSNWHCLAPHTGFEPRGR